MKLLAGSELEAEILSRLAEAGLTATIIVRDVDSGLELEIGQDRLYPIASLAKVAQALVILDRVSSGQLNGTMRVRVEPGRVSTAGPTGITRFRNHADIALEDAVYMSVALSDNAAADAMFDLVSPAEVTNSIAGWGIADLHIRHSFAAFTRTPIEALGSVNVDLAHSMAIGESTTGGGHRLAELDVTRTNAASARTLTDLLSIVWRPPSSRRAVQGPSDDARIRLQEYMAAGVHRQRLAPDFASDASTWASKTGTLLNLRHEMGVVEHRDGQRVAVVVLTESAIPASNQPHAELVMGAVARQLHDHLRDLPREDVDPERYP